MILNVTFLDLSSMITQKKTANAVGGRTARPCESCLTKRARWFCAADDAFLCHGCDSSVHSANQLASRHDRVRIETASSKPTTGSTLVKESAPAWHHGFTRKARTPRNPKTLSVHPANSLPLVPEMGSEETSLDGENEDDQLLYRVPTFDPFVAELCNASNEEGKKENVLITDNGLDNLPVYLPSDVDLEEFALDVESLLGRGLDQEEGCFGIKELGLLDCKEDANTDVCVGSVRRVKVEGEEEEEGGLGLDMSREMLDWNFDYEEEEGGAEGEVKGEGKAEMRRSICLRLDYQGVINAWASKGSPWSMGTRPDFNLDDCWPDYMDTCLGEVGYPYGEMVVGGYMGGGDGGREARVSRYREKRRTRLFSKKIRYEVRKLNAEKRPRMKGRFVKRTSYAGGPPNPFPYLNK